MKQELYEFRITPMSEEHLPQIRNALEKRTELLSRSRYPNMWKATDRLNSLPRKKKDPKREKMKYILFVVLGLFCAVPGAMKPGELLVPLVFGVAAFLWGAFGLLRNRLDRPDPFERPARFLWEQESVPEDANVLFTEGYMLLTAESMEDLIPYDKLEFVIEAEDIFLIFFAENILVLKKSDLVCGTAQDFRGFIGKHTVFVPYDCERSTI